MHYDGRRNADACCGWSQRPMFLPERLIVIFMPWSLSACGSARGMRLQKQAVKDDARFNSRSTVLDAAVAAASGCSLRIGSHEPGTADGPLAPARWMECSRAGPTAR